MDPVTQGALGAAAAQAVLGGRKEIPAGALWLMGAAGGMAADLDVLIRSAEDPLLKILFHRHFTHSLIFIPIGGLICALPWLIPKKYRPHWRQVLAATTIGYATHGVLDACTTYGTLLLWPFSDHRVNWGLVSVIDPMFTFPLIAAVVIAARRKLARPAIAGLAWCLLYLSLGGMQHYRAHSVQERLAAKRGHTIERSDVFVSFANNITWRSVYEAGGVLYADKIRVPWLGRGRASEGETRAALDASRLPAGVQSNPETARALRLIKWFAADWVAQDPEDPAVVGDLRYSFSPEQFSPIWGVRLKPGDRDRPVEWVNNRRKRSIDTRHIVQLVFEDGPRPIYFE
ncbi:MAG: metal-dependent hydrolase [Chrysiogenetes bacterium]|nr:metal-dependent hydrolase [Chrysiogenetes bacterium]